MSKNRYDTVSDCLDIFIRQIVKISALVPGTGLLTGKIGIAILLYQYARYRNDSKMTEYADHLIDIALQDLSFTGGNEFDSGLCGIAWCLDYLMKKEFVQADEDMFEEIDTVLFQEKTGVSNFNNLGVELGKGLYILKRLSSCVSSAESVWSKRIENLVYHLRDILMLRDTGYKYPVLSCRILIRFFHICQTLREHNLYIPEIDALYEELPETVNIFYRKGKIFLDKYMLATLLYDIPVFKECIPTGNIPQSMTLTDVNNFYLTRLVLNRSFPIPEALSTTIISIVRDQQRISELLYLLNPNNAGLGNYACGLAWAMLQWCMEQDKKTENNIKIINHAYS